MSKEQVKVLSERLCQLEADKKDIEEQFNPKINDLKEQIEELQKQINQLEVERVAATFDITTQIVGVKHDIGILMRNEKMKKFDDDMIRISKNEHHYDRIADFNFVNQKEIKANEDIIKILEEEEIDAVSVKESKVVKSVDITKLKTAINNGKIQIINDQLVTEAGQPLPIELERKDEIELKITYK